MKEMFAAAPSTKLLIQFKIRIVTLFAAICAAELRPTNRSPA